MSTSLKGWHHGELLMQRKLQYDSAVVTSWTWIHADMPEQHREFHSSRLHFVPVTTLDASGRPWASILAGADGQPGFIQSPRETILEMRVRTWEGDPIRENLCLEEGNVLLAGLGIEFGTRRRNKFAGRIADVGRDGDLYRLKVDVNQATGNCPKYINIRELEPCSSHPVLIYRKLSLSPPDRLPDEVIAFIHDRDTVFLATSYHAPDDVAKDYPSHVGHNSRGGKPGFVRVGPSDGRTVILPDYSGNRWMSSLGNIEVTPLAGLTFLDFTSGTILYLTGEATNLLGPAAQRIMPRQNALTTIYTTGYIFVSNALPVRQRPGTAVQTSPYSPPVLPLAEEGPASTYFADENEVTATLTKIEIHGSGLATFTWEASQELQIQAGQAAIMDFSALLGAREYAHMAPENPTSVNDDRIRTWTISRAGTWHQASSAGTGASGTRTFALTMRHKPGGAVTTALFTIAAKLAQLKPEVLEDTRPLELRVRLVGISGDFVLPGTTAAQVSSPPMDMLWFAGGIGVTPFLAMLSALSSAKHTPVGSVRLVLATREPAIFLPLISLAIRSTPSSKLVVDVYSNSLIPDLENDHPCAVLRKHGGRFPSDLFPRDYCNAKEIYMCGPPPFEAHVLETLAVAGVEGSRVHREGFAY